MLPSLASPMLQILWLLVALSAQSAQAHNAKPVWHANRLRILLDNTGASKVVPSVTEYTGPGQVIQVSISRPPRQALVNDVVALYSPAAYNPTSIAPITFRNITALNPQYPKTGSATIAFKLINLRSDYVFRIIENGTFWNKWDMTPVVVAESSIVRNRVASLPGQVHLAPHADGHSVVVQWVSASSQPQQLQWLTWPDKHSRPYSTDTFTNAASSRKGGKATQQVQSTTRTYTASMMCGEPASSFGFIPPGYMHTAIVPGGDLGHDQWVQYRVGSSEAGWSAVFSFTSAPDPAAVAQGKNSFTFLVFNDVGQENLVLFNETVCPPYCPLGWAFDNYTTNSTKLVKQLSKEEEARLALLVGDLSYANGVQAEWDYFGSQFESVFSRWPLAVAPGNHERDQVFPGLNYTSADSGGECNVPYTYRYYTPAWEAVDPENHKMSQGLAPQASNSKNHKPVYNPSQLDAKAPEQSNAHALPQHKAPDPWQQPQLQRLPQWLNPNKSYYSFNMANVHFLMLDSESASHPGSPQHAFVAEDLAKIDRRAYPWVVACLHRQMWGPTTNKINILNLARLQADYEDLFMKYRVDLVLHGHDHAYARMCPLYKGKCMHGRQPSSPMLLAQNGSIAGRGPNNSSSSSSATGMSMPPQQQQLHTETDPGAPIYVLAGHAGAGFTHAFPKPLPSWVEYGVQDQNGYLRVTVSGSMLTLVSVSTDDGHIMDGVRIIKTRQPA